VVETIEKGPVEAVWQKGGEDTTYRGDRVIWGYFYASPDEVTWGDQNNPDVFVKIWFDVSGRVDVNFFHVSVPDIVVYSDYPYDGIPEQQGTTTLATRYIRHTYENGQSFSEEQEEDGNPAEGYSPAGNPRGYSIIADLIIGSMINTEEKGPIEALWSLGGRDTTDRGDEVIWGYFYANPDEVTWGNADNPDLFVKIWFDISGRIDVNFFHVSVPDIEVYSDYPQNCTYDQKGTSIMAVRYVRNEYDQVSPSVRLISKNEAGQAGNGSSDRPSISGDGRYVAFESEADNLVGQDTNEAKDIFVYDRVNSQITRVSVSTAGEQGNQESGRPFISANGQVVAFQSKADNLVEGDTNGVPDIFVKDLVSGEIERIGIEPEPPADLYEYMGCTTPSLSAEGRYVAFFSYYTHAWYSQTYGDIVLFDRQSQTGKKIHIPSNGDYGYGGYYSRGEETNPVVSQDGRWVVFESNDNSLVEDDTNGIRDIFAYDSQTERIERVSVDSQGQQAASFRYCVTGSDCVAAPLSGHSTHPSISADGRYVVFASAAKNLAIGDPGDCTGTCFQCLHCLGTNIFLHDRELGRTSLVSVDADGNEAKYSSVPMISGDGRHVSFWSWADNLVECGTNGGQDIYIRDLNNTSTKRIPVGILSGVSAPATIRSDGQFVAFGSDAKNLLVNDTSNTSDVFIYPAD
jgi:Tol biopolymer transport system component